MTENEERLTRTIKALSLKRKPEGSIGFMTVEEDGRWYNVHAEEAALDEMLNIALQKGNKIEFGLALGIPTNITLIEKAKAQSKGNAEGGLDDMTTFEELLDDAHKKFEGNFTIKTELISHDAEKKAAVFKAIVEITDEGSCYEYQAHGDADQSNTGEMVKIHYLRMAETRAIARALRWATNNAKCAAEETEHGELTEEEMLEELEEQQKQP